MIENIKYDPSDEIMDLRETLAQLHNALSIIADMDDYHQALVYDTLCDVGYYDHEDDMGGEEHENYMEGKLS